MLLCMKMRKYSKIELPHIKILNTCFYCSFGNVTLWVNLCNLKIHSWANVSFVSYASHKLISSTYPFSYNHIHCPPAKILILKTIIFYTNSFFEMKEALLLNTNMIKIYQIKYRCTEHNCNTTNLFTLTVILCTTNLCLFNLFWHKSQSI